MTDRTVSMFSALALGLILTLTVQAQTAAFTYQGKLADGGSAANGQYDFTFKLFAAVSGGSQIGGDVTVDDVQVTAGAFTVNLNFTSVPFTSMTGNYLEIAVRPGASTGAYTMLTPRHPITSAPYSLQSFNARNLGGLQAAEFVQNNDVRLFDARVPLPGSFDYLQNTTTQQTANFNINGTGTANIFNAATQYNIGGNRVLSVSGIGNTNFFAGVGAGSSNSTGFQNSFFGFNSGLSNTTGNANSFFGSYSGTNSTGGSNSFFGSESGQFNITGGNNVFVGYSAGRNNSSGIYNTFLGTSSGFSSISGDGNTFIGALADSPGQNSLINGTAIGSRAAVTQNNSLVLGAINGVNGATTDTSVGIGTSAPQYKLHVVGENVRVEGNTTGTLPRFSMNFTGGLQDEKKWQNYAAANRLSFTALNDTETAETFWLLVNRGTGTAISSVTFPNGNVGIGTITPTAMLEVTAGGTTLADAWTVRSSARFKSNIQTIPFALNKVMQLRGVTFDYKDTRKNSIGFIAEEVGRVLPEVVEYEANGRDAKGMDYNRLTPVVVEAIKEQQQEIQDQQLTGKQQQTQIEALTTRIQKQQAQIERQQGQIDALTKLICQSNPRVEICREKKN